MWTVCVNRRLGVHRSSVFVRYKDWREVRSCWMLNIYGADVGLLCIFQLSSWWRVACDLWGILPFLSVTALRYLAGGGAGWRVFSCVGSVRAGLRYSNADVTTAVCPFDLGLPAGRSIWEDWRLHALVDAAVTGRVSRPAGVFLPRGRSAMARPPWWESKPLMLIYLHVHTVLLLRQRQRNMSRC